MPIYSGRIPTQRSMRSSNGLNVKALAAASPRNLAREAPHRPGRIGDGLAPAVDLAGFARLAFGRLPAVGVGPCDASTTVERALAIYAALDAVGAALSATAADERALAALGAAHGPLAVTIASGRAVGGRARAVPLNPST